MRFLMLMYPNPAAEEGTMPTAEQIAAMMKYNEDLGKAGALLALDGLQPSSKGVRLHFDGGAPRIVDGPFTEAKEIVGGYWIVQVKSREEALEWARRCPADKGNMIELRQIFEMSDFAPETVDQEQFQRVADMLPKA